MSRDAARRRAGAPGHAGALSRRDLRLQHHVSAYELRCVTGHARATGPVGSCLVGSCLVGGCLWDVFDSFASPRQLCDRDTPLAPSLPRCLAASLPRCGSLHPMRPCRLTGDFVTQFDVVNTCCAPQPGGAAGASCSTGVPFDCDVGCSQMLLPSMDQCFRHARNMDSIHAQLYSGLEMECELMEYLPGGHRGMNPKVEAPLPIVPCDRSAIGDQLQAITDNCCIRGALNCQGTVPDACSLQCAAVFLPFWAQCAVDFTDTYFGALDVELMHTFARTCLESWATEVLELYEAIDEQAAAGPPVEHHPIPRQACHPSAVRRACAVTAPVMDDSSVCSNACVDLLVGSFDDCMASSNVEFATLVSRWGGPVAICRTLIEGTGAATPLQPVDSGVGPADAVALGCVDDPDGVIASQGYTCSELIQSVTAYGGCNFRLTSNGQDIGAVGDLCHASCRTPCADGAATDTSSVAPPTGSGH
jgi:hypothetical protein